MKRIFIFAAVLLSTVNVDAAASLREQSFELSIERGTLASVFQQLADETGLHIGSEISVTKIRANNFGPFKAHATADEAMKSLLRGTDLWYAWRDDQTVRVFRISSQRSSWSSGGSSAQEASEAIRGLAGVYYETGRCGDLPVGPFNPAAPITAETFWVELIKPYCPVKSEPSSTTQPGSIDRLTPAGQTEHHFSIPKILRVLALRQISEQAGVGVSYVSSDTEEEQTLVGPISGVMSLNEALRVAMQNSVLHVRWNADDIATVEPAYTITRYADMSACLCNFGLPERRLPESQRVTVVAPRLPPLQAYTPGPVASFDRAFIESTGASTIPELLNYLPQQAFSRSRGFRPNAAQYFEGRGFGAQFPLVLVDGYRVYGSAADPQNYAFDLNVVPLPAVERIDVALDQASVVHGTDAIGATVNVKLRRDLKEGSATLEHGSARGGAERDFATLYADASWGNVNAGFVLNHMQWGDLLGSTRNRWNDQDFSRYTNNPLDDYRSAGAPPNVRAVAGNLPGLNASAAALTFDPGGGGLTIRPNELNRQSALASAAIVPEQERSGVYGFTRGTIRSAQFNVSLLLGWQAASLQLFPASTAGFIWGANHPQNPFHANVMIDTLLTGLPPRQQEVESRLTRLAADVSGPVREWTYTAFAVTQEDNSRAWFTNLVDPLQLQQSLLAQDRPSALNVLTDRPGSGAVAPGLFLPRDIERYMTAANQYGLNLTGPLFSTWAGKIEADLGIARREESVRFDPNVGELERDVNSVFWRVRAPVIRASSASLLRGLELTVGGRIDAHNDVSDVTTWQYGFNWAPHPAIRMYASYSDLYRPPSLYELYLPRISLPIEIYDPKRSQVTAITLLTGGNPLLHPTHGESLDVGVSINTVTGWTARLNYWETSMTDRVSVVLFQDLLNAPPEVVAGRIQRAAPSAADLAADRPGQLLSLDTTRANFGALKARGFDLSIEHTFETWFGRLMPRLDVTQTVDFRYRDLPAGASPMSQRVGIASLYGTIPKRRAVASITWERGDLRTSLFARYHTSYQDYSLVEGAATDHRVPEQTLLDVKVSKYIRDRLTLSIGARNVLDHQAPFAQVGGWEGFDQSQGELLGRESYLEITGSF